MQINIRAMCVMLLWIFCLSMFIDLWEHQNMKIEIFQKIQINTQATCDKGDWENSAVFTYLHIYFLKINSVTIQIVNDIHNI